MNPRLCRVISYSLPGFPSPTINFIVLSPWSVVRSQLPHRYGLLTTDHGLFLFGLAALLDHFGFGGCSGFTFRNRSSRRNFLDHLPRQHAPDDLGFIRAPAYSLPICKQTRAG